MEEVWKVYKESNLPKTHKKYRKYEVSNLGRVKKNGIIINQKINKIGYYDIGGFRIHRAVAELFVPNPNNYNEVNHIDGNKLNNNSSNLEWVTRNENMSRYFNSESYKIKHEAYIKEHAKNKNNKENLMKLYPNDLYKLTNTETGDVYYCIKATDYCKIAGCSQATRYSFELHGKWRDWRIETIDGTHIEWGQIYKHAKD